MYVDSRDENRKEDNEGLSEVSGEVVLIVVTVVLTVIVMISIINFAGLLQEGQRAAVTFSENHADNTITVTAITMGNSDGIVIRGFENYPTEDGGEPVLLEAGVSVKFRFNTSGTENSGTLAAVGVRGSITESEDSPRYGEEKQLMVVDDSARQTVIQRRAYNFDRR